MYKSLLCYQFIKYSTYPKNKEDMRKVEGRVLEEEEVVVFACTAIDE